MNLAGWGFGELIYKFDMARKFMLRQALPRVVLQFFDEIVIRAGLRKAA